MDIEDLKIDKSVLYTAMTGEVYTGIVLDISDKITLYIILPYLEYPKIYLELEDVKNIVYLTGGSK